MNRSHRKMHKVSRRRGRRGFTLIEVLLVLAILVMLGAVAVTQFRNVRAQAKVDIAKSQIAEFANAIEVFDLNCDGFPSTASGLEALRQVPSDVPVPEKWAGPYINKQIPLDPWNNPYQYSTPGRYNVDSYDLWSWGPDGTDGTKDDVGNWTN